MDSGLSLMKTIFTYSSPMYFRTISADARIIVLQSLKISFLVFIGFKLFKNYSTGKSIWIKSLKNHNTTANLIYSRVSFWWTWLLMAGLLEIIVGEWTGRYYKIDSSNDNFSDTTNTEDNLRMLTANPS